ncbi:histidinol-phosphate transaminase [Oscillatoriales cyanobacterium LEGE 11467]|uniref:Histidinol-phosphate aminotransferase n=1 Tax=Zarconia navalis LEGE 11467 TaxID=1828826 RepID=A0A928Z6T8_9CYAN|nr:histidinol-phosphate transaminase [Zarconia navalis]MBE9039865.1 histidinol-phosphate transaminase [Zarconia navalis LEGE 11467]
MTTYFRPSIDALSPYVPGEQPASKVPVIKLNTNENPYPPSPKALKVLQEIPGELLRRYPHPMAREFRQAASQVLGVPADWILVGNGSDDLLTMIIRACTEPGRSVAYPMPTYVLYRTLAQIQAADVVEVPYPEDYTLPVEALVAAGGAVTFIASPNSPSGTEIPVELLDKLASQVTGVVVIDEAYVDFAETSALDLVKRYENVIVLRTLSKGYSLAGLRLGFGVANPTLLSGLIKVKDSYNVDAVACAVGAAAILDREYKDENAEKVKKSRSEMVTALNEFGFEIWPSQANFLLVRVPASVRAEWLYQQLKERGILVRYFQQSRLADKLRITIGTPEQNAALLDNLSSLLQKS